MPELANLALWDRMIQWLDTEEGRALELVNANPDFEGPAHCMGWSTLDMPSMSYVYGDTREACFATIIEAAKKGAHL